VCHERYGAVVGEPVMIYGSVCSGIEAAAVKPCCKCGAVQPLDAFHRQPTGPMGRHSWCKPCANAAQKRSREKHGRPPVKRAWNFKTRYGLTLEQIAEMRAAQGGVCAICGLPMRRECVDHCHNTGRVRGLLCHRCNVLLRGLEDADYRARAASYLGISL
jgi:hypothetical protein